MKLSKKKVYEMGKILGVNFNMISVETLYKGVLVEFEHGYVSPKTNITNDSLLLTTKIALAHLEEYPDYYERLERLEQQAKRYWNHRKRNSIFTL